MALFLFSLVMWVVFTTAVKLNGVGFDTEGITQLLEKYQNAIKTDSKLPSFAFLSFQQEVKLKAQSFEGEPRTTFEAAAKGAWSADLPAFDATTYAIASIGSQSSSVLAVQSGTVASLDMGAEFENFGVKNSPSKPTIHKFMKTLKEKLKPLTATADKNVYVFFMNSIGYGVKEESVHFVHLGEAVTGKFALKDNAGKMGQEMAKAWNAEPKLPASYIGVIKNRALKPKIGNEWVTAALKEAAGKAVLDISGNAVTVYMSGKPKTKIDCKINDLVRKTLTFFRYATPKTGLIKKKAETLVEKVMTYVTKAVGGMGITLNDIGTAYQTGILRSLNDAIAALPEKKEAGAKRVNANYYDVRYYEENEEYHEEEDTYNERDVEIFRAGYAQGYLSAAKQLRNKRKVYNAGQRLRNYYYGY